MSDGPHNGEAHCAGQSAAMSDRPRRWLMLAAFLAACFAVAAGGALFTSASLTTWYAGLAKPAWTPPGWVFGPVWTVLYASMAVAAWLVWSRRTEGSARRALLLFWVQLLLNALWSPLFFGLRSPSAALIDIVALWALILGTSMAFCRVRRVSGWLLTPYLLWVTFAMALNAAIWHMNT